MPIGQMFVKIILSLMMDSNPCGTTNFEGIQLGPDVLSFYVGFSPNLRKYVTLEHVF